jgi:hypothetical protein
MNDDRAETIEIMEQQGLVSADPWRTPFCSGRKARRPCLPDEARRARGRAADARRTGRCDGGRGLALRGRSASPIPGTLRPRRPARAIASVTLTRRRLLPMSVEGGVLSGSAGPQRRLRSGRLHSKTQEGALAPPILGFTACKAPHRRLFRSEDGTAVAPRWRRGVARGRRIRVASCLKTSEPPALRVFVLRIFRHSSQLCTDSGQLSC